MSPDTLCNRTNLLFRYIKSPSYESIELVLVYKYVLAISPQKLICNTNITIVLIILLPTLSTTSRATLARPSIQTNIDPGSMLICFGMWTYHSSNRRRCRHLGLCLHCQDVPSSGNRADLVCEGSSQCSLLMFSTGPICTQDIARA